MTHDELIEAVAEKLDDWLGDTGTSLDMARAAIRVIAPAVLEEAREAWTDNWYDFQDHIDAMKTRYEV